MEPLVKALASVLYVGYVPFAPGTFGTLAAIPIAVVFAQLGTEHAVAAVMAFVGFVFLAIAVAGRAEELFGEKDSGRIVIDEVAGYLAATMLLPVSWSTVITAFVLFRLFDILKPFPAAWVDREWSGGAAVVLDDVIAGLYTQVVLRFAVALGWL